ncbi:hypothetical protein [Amycolatopsis acididurans]|uniref:hypothetical protein n=1 Tax=Amycolatopsis acididurans TaxID=2724524 RepID=UPI001B328624|nr:hypothetical protein [Amycolatopsis acididurans]
MNVPALLPRLYPPGIRERWGSEIVREARLAGPRAWFDTAAGAAKLWLHPSDWPETASGQTTRVLATTFVAVTTAAALLVRAAGSDVLTASVDRPATSAWLAPILAGVALAAPLPPPHWAALGRLAAAAARTLIAPGLAFGILFLIAHSGSSPASTAAVSHGDPRELIRKALPKQFPTGIGKATQIGWRSPDPGGEPNR